MKTKGKLVGVIETSILAVGAGVSVASASRYRSPRVTTALSASSYSLAGPDSVGAALEYSVLLK